MATPLGILSLPINNGSSEQALNAASVPTLAGFARIAVFGASIIWTDQPLAASGFPGASPITASAAMPWSPAAGILTVNNPAAFRYRDLGAGGLIVFSFYQGAPDLGL